jgi:hypothetical protein
MLDNQSTRDVDAANALAANPQSFIVRYGPGRGNRRSVD